MLHSAEAAGTAILANELVNIHVHEPGVASGLGKRRVQVRPATKPHSKVATVVYHA